MNRIYTKTGDDGTTGVFAGPRVAKDDDRIEAYGTIDELNAVLGVALTQQPADEIAALLLTIQHQLFDLGAELATPDPAANGMRKTTDEKVEALANAIDKYEADLPPLTSFILPGGTPFSGTLHLARTVCRRAERHIVTLSKSAEIAGEVIRYVNRLSDLLFVLARVGNKDAGGDVLWQGG